VRLPNVFRYFPPEVSFTDVTTGETKTAEAWAICCQNDNDDNYEIERFSGGLKKSHYLIMITHSLIGNCFVSDSVPQIKDNHDRDTNNPVANTLNGSGRAFRRIGIEGRKIYEICSIPGDNRQYVFIVFQDDGHRFFFIGLNGFKYPSVLKLKRFDYTDFEISLLACQTNCETATVKECIRTAEIISKEHR